MLVTQVSALWASQQAVNMIFLPMLDLRKFNGKEICLNQKGITSTNPQVTFATGRYCAHGLFKPSLFCP